MAKFLFVLVLLTSVLGNVAKAASPMVGPEFEISFPPSARSEPVTGRLLLMLSKTDQPEVRYQVGWINSPPVFGIDVSALKPEKLAIIDGSVPGFPLQSLNSIPPGEYYVQALLNIYTEFHRADGHVIWAHNDQWEGQSFSRSPGNLFSKVRKIRVGGAGHEKFKLSLTEVIPPLKVPADTEWVKYVKIRSNLLSQFWGRPMYLGAVVLLPRGYADHPETHYPVIYEQGHFSLEAPFGFRIKDTSETEDERREREALGVETGYEFYREWNSDEFPRVIAVRILHPTPYFDDSYAVDSVNSGPYGTAIMDELIPYIEKTFRIINQPYARVLTGGSTGGWESLALQLFHPNFFDGTWVLYPDPVDFRRFQLANIYKDDNMFVLGSGDVPEWARQDWVSSERAFARGNDGQTIATVRQESQLEATLGSHGRSGGQLAVWGATFGPVGVDGYPEPLFDPVTGVINHEVALYMRDHDYDLRYYAEKNWPRIGNELSGKLKLYCGDMDNYYLNLAVYLFGQFLNKVDSSGKQTLLEYGSPLKGHGWQPMSNAALVRLMSERVAARTPEMSSLARSDPGS